MSSEIDQMPKAVGESITLSKEEYAKYMKKFEGYWRGSATGQVPELRKALEALRAQVRALGGEPCV